MKIEKPSTMTKQEFDSLAQHITDNCIDEVINEDFKQFTDAAGNWYRISNAGFSQEIFYAGIHYYIKYKYVPGVPSDCSISVWETTDSKEIDVSTLSRKRSSASDNYYDICDDDNCINDDDCDCYS